jgi:hypothetical protein
MGGAIAAKSNSTSGRKSGIPGGTLEPEYADMAMIYVETKGTSPCAGGHLFSGDFSGQWGDYMLPLGVFGL